MTHDILLRELELGANEETFAVVGVVRTVGPTAVKAGNKAIIKTDGTVEGWVGGHCTEDEIRRNAMESMRDGGVRFLNLSTCHGGRMDVYIEPYLPKRKLVIFGHIPIVSALSEIAKTLNFKVVIVDKQASKEKFPRADSLLKMPEQLGLVHINNQTYVVIATMGEFDQENAERVVGSDAPYIGIVAGKKRASDIFQYLHSRNLPKEQISKVRSPAGIYLRAVTAEEIALSIMAEIVELARKQVMDHRGYRSTRALMGASSGPREVEKDTLGAVLLDPVCGMTVQATSDYRSTSSGRTVLFCSKACMILFNEHPSNYLVKESPSKRPG